MKFKIATWNINSVRLRIDLVCRFLKTWQPDVWSQKHLLKIVSHTPAETERLTKAQAAGRWVDIVRHHVPPEQKLYTWWSYRARDWAASDRGRRLDHIWMTPGLTKFSSGIE